MNTDSRQAILSRVRATARGAAQEGARSFTTGSSAFPHSYIRTGQRDAAARVALFIERVREYDAELVQCAASEVAATIAAQLAASGRSSFLAPTGLPAEWRSPGFDWKIDSGLSFSEIEQAEGVVTAAFCAVADSGTVVLHHSAAEGRRALTLIPDWHLCVLRATQVVETLPEYFARCASTPPLVTWISGPSATADIEMTRIKGVHGPRYLHILLVGD